MSASTLRRRLHHGDVDGKRKEHFDTSCYGSLSEPLLKIHECDDLPALVMGLTLEDIWNSQQRRQCHHWTLIFSQLMDEWAHWLGSGSLIGRFFPFAGQSRDILHPYFGPLQEERLRKLQQRLGVSFDRSQVVHQDALKLLWRLAYPGRELPSLKSDLWKEMGWQGSDPSTDFRGGGFVSLENLIFFAKMYPDSFQRLLHKKDGTRAKWEYPFAVAGINISFMLLQMLDLQTGKPSTLAGIKFAEFLAGDEMAFDNLYCVAFQMMDAQWLAKRASYMEFNDVLKSTRMELERELARKDVHRVKDLPAYNLLKG
ncbi:ELMO domain-containing protein A isoform X2 [Manihot esculenta]|uniref:Uncharacterized protein n=4 Tax=Manihot esculenta TaxID=3983 RepID=A0ACB7HAR7_MANES|nr:ELMO domain-containing protein A isoform X2 [Manihot esculenta]KAG8647979.1 hypothetical protein MANES_09G134700v8 [Manihot esculenta]KAG8647981.1 hypothetical protein MANES_09G134700v8 [Manihot esculenta]KAG8647982.1 hypothetical protein MANES_09G134700v8 [Manihot esculenta]KAG8647984.1 hypothetical protein MANES_09G134700v8 [Manihot esculenta]